MCYKVTITVDTIDGNHKRKVKQYEGIFFKIFFSDSRLRSFGT